MILIPYLSDGWHRYDVFLRYDWLIGISSRYRRPMVMGSHSEQKNPLFHYVLKQKRKQRGYRPAGYSVMCGSEGEGSFIPSES